VVVVSDDKMSLAGVLAPTMAELIAPSAGTRFQTLRPAQETALLAYAADAHALHDIGVELPTGGGKTLIALLVLEYWRKQGRRVAILTGNKTLARQIEREARDLGVPTVRFEGSSEQFAAKDLRAYRRAGAIAVTNYWVYINQNPAVDPAEYVALDRRAASGRSAAVSVHRAHRQRGAWSPL
jgi:Type III restriction enzyme, res subunit